MIYHFILNPKSGKSPRQKKLEDQIKASCQKRQLDYHIYYTTCVGDATEYVRSMIRIENDRQRFICSGNDFVRNFTNTKHFCDIEAQIDGTPHQVDLIKCNDFYCVNMVNIGFDCAVVKESVKFKKIKLLPPGFSYILGVVAVLFKKFGTKMKLLFDDGTVLDQVFTLTAIANGKFCGGGFMASPKALLCDGMLNVTAIDKVSRLTFISLVSSYKKGTYLENKRAMKVIKHFTVPHFKMEFDSPIPICIDGEIKGAKNIDFSVVRNAFNFVIPKGCELKYKG